MNRYFQDDYPNYYNTVRFTDPIPAYYTRRYRYKNRENRQRSPYVRKTYLREGMVSYEYDTDRLNNNVYRVNSYSGKSARYDNTTGQLQEWVIRKTPYTQQFRRTGYQQNDFSARSIYDRYDPVTQRNTVSKPLETYEITRTDYIPYGFSRGNDDTYTSDDSTLRFRIVDYNNNYGCYHDNLSSCAVRASQDFLQAQNIDYIINQHQETQWKSVVSGSANTYPISLERYKTKNTNGTETVFYLYTLKHPNSQKLIRIEGASRTSDAGENERIMKNILNNYKLS